MNKLIISMLQYAADTISAHPFLEPTGVVTQTLFEVQNVIATLGYEVTAKLTIVSHESNIKVDPENDVLYITFGKQHYIW